MDKIRLEILGLSANQTQTGSFALVLGEENGKRRLPIIIGVFEAQAIAIEIEKIVPNRPMTHDLFKSFAENFGFSLEEIIISDLKEGIFFATIVCSDGIKKVHIDARPSDAIAIGIRFNVPIYTNEAILSEAGIMLSEYTEETLEGDFNEELQEEEHMSFQEQLKTFNSDQLKLMLEDALNDENYERAAKIRDELNKRN